MLKVFVDPTTASFILFVALIELFLYELDVSLMIFENTDYTINKILLQFMIIVGYRLNCVNDLLLISIRSIYSYIKNCFVCFFNVI